MTAATTSQDASHKPSLDRRLVFMALGMFFGLLMGLLLWCVNLVAHTDYPVLSSTFCLMVVEGVIGFLVAQRDKGKFEDLLNFIVAFFIVP